MDSVANLPTLYLPIVSGLFIVVPILALSFIFIKDYEIDYKGRNRLFKKLAEDYKLTLEVDAYSIFKFATYGDVLRLRKLSGIVNGKNLQIEEYVIYNLPFQFWWRKRHLTNEHSFSFSSRNEDRVTKLICDDVITDVSRIERQFVMPRFLLTTVSRATDKLGTRNGSDELRRRAEAHIDLNKNCYDFASIETLHSILTNYPNITTA